MVVGRQPSEVARLFSSHFLKLTKGGEAIDWSVVDAQLNGKEKELNGKEKGRI